MRSWQEWAEAVANEVIAGGVIALASWLAVAIWRVLVGKRRVLERYEEYSDAHYTGNDAEALSRLREAFDEWERAFSWYPLPSRRRYREVARRIRLELDERDVHLVKLLYPMRDLREGAVDPLRGAHPDEVDAARRGALERFEKRWKYVIGCTAVLLPLAIALLVAMLAGK